MAERPMTADEPRKPVPLIVPPLLSFVAGYVDSITFLALFGFFAAHVTGSFVVAAAELVVSDRGVIVKMLAIPAFMLGAGVGAAIIIARRGRKDSSLPLVFALETILLAAFLVLLLQSWPVILPESWTAGAAGLLAATAMGVQSALVRLLLRDVPQTNVMSGNSTQLAIEAAEIIYARGLPPMQDSQGVSSKHGNASLLSFRSCSGFSRVRSAGRLLMLPPAPGAHALP